MTTVNDSTAIPGTDESTVATLRFRTLKRSLTPQFAHRMHNATLAARLLNYLMLRSPEYLDATRPNVNRDGDNFTVTYDPRAITYDQILEWIDLRTRYELAE